ncbi:MAG: hypothetical protein IKQ56_01490 [Lachnospiraceae bacterium]|nr:hypothetical protein [Lachnospiraceae bacterium]
MRAGRAKVNFMESCTCGYDLETIQSKRYFRFVIWNCPKCGKELASTMLSDSPVTGFYVLKALYHRTNHKLRQEKNLEPRKTVVSFFDEDGKRIPWKDVEAENRRWERRVGGVQRKPF